jgi:hypothetical protein
MGIWYNDVMSRKVKKLFSAVIAASVLVVGLIYGVNYTKHYRLVKAVSALPMQFGGLITFYQPKCVSDPETGICANCPKCTNPGLGVGNYVCNGYQEISFIPAGGSKFKDFVCVPMGFKYLGGGTVPRVGGFIVGGGASNILPWVIGISK